MDELFDFFDEAGNQLGTAQRAEVHRTGLWHRASNIFVFNPDGTLLIQRRQLTKDICPGAWDVSAAEHLQPGESFEDGAHRGLAEELGIVGVELAEFGSVTKSRLEDPESGIRDYEFQQSFHTVYDGPVSPDSSEVMEVRTIQAEELESAFLENPNDFTPWFRQRALELALFSNWLIS